MQTLQYSNYALRIRIKNIIGFKLLNVFKNNKYILFSNFLMYIYIY